MSANRRFETLFDLHKIAANVECRCACGHRSTVDGQKLTRWFLVNCWDTRVSEVRGHLRCLRCGGRPYELRPSNMPPTAPDRFPRDEAAWQRKIKRLRD